MADRNPKSVLESELRAILQTLPSARESELVEGRVYEQIGHIGTIGLFLKSLKGSYENSIARGVRGAARQRQCGLIVFVGADYATKELILDEVVGRKLDGAVIASAALGLSVEDVSWIAGRLVEREPAPALVSIGVSAPGVRSLIIDDGPKTRQLVEHFYDSHALRRIAFIGGPAVNVQATRRLNGYTERMKEYGLEPIAIRGDFEVESGDEAVRMLLKENGTIEAVICGNDRMALGAMRALHLLGMDRNVQLSGFDDGAFAAVGCFTTVDQDPAGQGYRAMTLLFDQILGVPYKGPQEIATRLVVGRLCGCVATNATVGFRPGEIVAILQSLRSSESEAESVKRLVANFVDAVYSGNFEPFLGQLAELTVSAHREEVMGWQRILTELRNIIECQKLDAEMGHIALRVLGEATSLVALADQRAWLEFEARQDKVNVMAHEMQSTTSESAVWDIARRQFSRLLEHCVIFEKSKHPPGEEPEGPEKPLKTILVHPDGTHAVELALTRESGEMAIIHRIALGNHRVGIAVFDMDSRCDWSTQEKLVECLQSGLAHAQATERLQRAYEVGRIEPGLRKWSETTQTRLELVAQFIRDSLRCDVVVIYPLYGERIPVRDIGPAIAGELRFPDLMLSNIRRNDAVRRLLEHGKSIFIEDTSEEGPFDDWFIRPGRARFQQRESIRSLLGYVLRWGPDNQVVGAMFCNYRELTKLEKLAPFCDRLAEHAALALAQELGGDLRVRTRTIPPPANV